MVSETTLRIEYAERTWHIELPEHLEQALEDDYVRRSSIYTDDFLKHIQTLYLIHPNITATELIRQIHNYHL